MLIGDLEVTAPSTHCWSEETEFLLRNDEVRQTFHKAQNQDR